jgi:hypothetical protein
MVPFKSVADRHECKNTVYSFSMSLVLHWSYSRNPQKPEKPSNFSIEHATLTRRFGESDQMEPEKFRLLKLQIRHFASSRIHRLFSQTNNAIRSRRHESENIVSRTERRFHIFIAWRGRCLVRSSSRVRGL